ncbi:MAG: hypothetical protein ABIU77_24525 [Ferruginibacter sp.]
MDSKASLMVFTGANDLWTATMKNIVNHINKSGGKASVDKEVVSKRVSYSSNVSCEDKSKIQNGGN